MKSESSNIEFNEHAGQEHNIRKNKLQTELKMEYRSLLQGDLLRRTVSI